MSDWSRSRAKARLDHRERLFGKVTAGSVRDVPPGEEPWRVFAGEITTSPRPDSGDTGAK